MEVFKNVAIAYYQGHHKKLHTHSPSSATHSALNITMASKRTSWWIFKNCSALCTHLPCLSGCFNLAIPLHCMLASKKVTLTVYCVIAVSQHITHKGSLFEATMSCNIRGITSSIVINNSEWLVHSIQTTLYIRIEWIYMYMCTCRWSSLSWQIASVLVAMIQWFQTSIFSSVALHHTCT